MLAQNSSLSWKTLIALSAFSLVQFADASCPDALLPEPNCAAGCTPVTSLVTLNINNGDVYCVLPGVTASIGTLNVDGGELRICGNAQIANYSAKKNAHGMTFNVGTTGKMNFTGPSDVTINGHTRISNRGQLLSDANLIVANEGNSIANGGGFTMKPTTQLTLGGPNSSFSNLRDASFGSIFAQDNHGNGVGKICLDGGSTTFTQDFDMEQDNVVSSSGSGPACFSLGGVGDFSKIASFANSSLIKICQRAGATTLPANAGTHWGQAVVKTNCTSCGGPLPVELTRFAAKNQGSSVALDWETASELNSKGFDVQKSDDGQKFSSLIFINGAGSSNTKHTYHADDRNPSKGTSYYRLAQEDVDGTKKFSQVIAIARGQAPDLDLGLNSSDANTVRFMSKDWGSFKNSDVSIYSMNGALIYHGTVSPDQELYDIHVSAPMSPGMYTMRVTLPDGTHVTPKFMRQ